MAIIATGAQTIVDLSDGKSLSVYLSCNQPKTQVLDPNPGGLIVPDWTQAGGKPVVTPVIYLNQTALALNAPGLTITWKRKEGSGSEAVLIADETVTANILTVSANKLTGVASGLLTYLAYVAYVDPETTLTANAVADITFAQVKTGVNAKLAWITGEQVFKYDAVGGVLPAQITLTAAVNNVSIVKWQFKNASSVWTDYPTTGDNANITSAALNVKPTHAVFVNSAATLRITTSDANISDTISIYKVADGTAGTAGSAGSNASVAFLTNENITFAGNVSGQVTATTRTCNVVAYTGTTKVTPTVGAVTGMPTGMTVAAGAAVANEIPLTITIASNATLGGAGQMSGVLTIPITSPVTTSLAIAWSKVNTGATGSTGAAGVNAVVFSVYAPDGSVFVNQGGSLLLQTAGYNGATLITTGATYVWKKYSAGSWNVIAGQTASSLTVLGTDVIGIGSYQCVLTYNSVAYTDTITLIDKTDNYQAVVDSTGGDVFKNTVGSSNLVCRLFQNGSEVDTMKSTVISVTAPATPATGDFYYKVTTSTPAVALMRWNGTAWVDVTADATYKHVKTYTWYRRDKDGVPLDGGAAFSTGKVIYVDGDDVSIKTTFVCEVA